MYKIEKGITLIALVITIIVLVILAAVAIGVLNGENGIINRSYQAKQNSGTQQELELVDLVITDLRTEETIGEEITEEKLQKHIDGVFGAGKATGTILTENNQTSYMIEVIGGSTYTIESKAQISDVHVEEPSPYYYGTELQTLYSGIYTNIPGEDTLITKTDNSDSKYNRKFSISKISFFDD